MKLYGKYITKLFFSRFFVILFCVVLFVVFRELTGVSSILTPSQTAMITPLFIPYFIFQFLPFVYFGSLLMTMNELYSNNELVSFKATGISYGRLVKVFMIIASIVMLFSAVIVAIYPAGLKQFYKQRNAFTATNLITQLKPKTINMLGENKLYFRRWSHVNRGGYLPECKSDERKSVDSSISDKELGELVKKELIL